MTHTRYHTGTCSSSSTVTLSDDGVIESITVEDGCEGNIAALCAVLAGRPAAQTAELFKNIPCGDKPSSCPQQISLCLLEALNESHTLK